MTTEQRKAARLAARATGYDTWLTRETARARRGAFVVGEVCFCGGLDCRQTPCRGEVSELALDVGALRGPLSADFFVVCE